MIIVSVSVSPSEFCSIYSVGYVLLVKRLAFSIYLFTERERKGKEREKRREGDLGKREEHTCHLLPS